VLLEQIADDNVDALVNLGCCLYKVKHDTTFWSIFRIGIFMLRQILGNKFHLRFV
jgi:hypothetical protein